MPSGTICTLGPCRSFTPRYRPDPVYHLEFGCMLAFLLGEGFYVRRTFAITLLSRVLSQNPLDKDSINLVTRGCELQIKQRQRLLNELNCLA